MKRWTRLFVVHQLNLMLMGRIEAEFLPAKESVAWANDAIAEFDAAARIFFQPDAARIVVEFDPQTGENVQKCQLIKPLPSDFRRKVTEALTALRHSFDQATFAAQSLAAGPPRASIYYPWAANPTDLIRLLKARNIDKRLWDVFIAHEPYKRSDSYAGGDNMVRALATIANKKHTVGMTIGGFVHSIEGGMLSAKYVTRLLFGGLKWDPVKNEVEIARWIGDVQSHGDRTVYFQVLLQDSRLPDRVTAKSALEAFSTKAHTVIESLQSKCSEIIV